MEDFSDGSGIGHGYRFLALPYMRGVWIARIAHPRLQIYRLVDHSAVAAYRVLSDFGSSYDGPRCSLLANPDCFFGDVARRLFWRNRCFERRSWFFIGMIGWAAIIYLIFFGEAAKVNEGSGNVNSQMAFKTIRLIVTVGWAIYPIGYALGYFGAGVDSGTLNIIYNIADLVNKTAFGLAIWYAAVQDSKDLA